MENGEFTPERGEAPARRSAGKLRSLREDLARAATVERVFGEPLELRDRTLIPVARVGFGFGAGVGRGRRRGEGEGEGEGGGLGAVPLGVFEVRHDRTRFVPVRPMRRLLTGLVAGVAVGYWLGRRAAGRAPAPAGGEAAG